MSTYEAIGGPLTGFADIEHSQLSHELLHFWFHEHAFLQIGGTDGGHARPEWRDCARWTQLWSEANAAAGTCVDYGGQWWGDGTGGGSNGCGWCLAQACDPSLPNDFECGH
ncbi:MAG TPA: hypothetical protein VMK42_14550 [Anaeromyxobacteraceae bacterium]|nr:hypothetical protein [Anaeromyxobacteraceae bacterium]